MSGSLAGYVRVPAGMAGDVAVLAGPRLLSGVVDPADLGTHRRRWQTPATWHPDELVAVIDKARLRGRGGAAFPFARKLATTLASGRRRAVVVNAAEGEPGSAKDSALLLVAPHVVLDGAAIVAGALGVPDVHLVVPGERPAIRAAVEKAVAEREAAPEFTVTETTGGFVGGQARAVLELLSGRENLPVTAWVPEAVSGLRGRPTLLSNAETFAQVAALCALGLREFARLGTAEEPGTTLVTVGGDGTDGVVAEVALGTSLPALLTVCGHDPTAPLVIGGYHGMWLREATGHRISRDELGRAGVSLGAGVLLPVSPAACPVRLTSRVVGYLAAQSARRCGPCRNGLPALADACAALAAGNAGDGVLARLQQLADLLPGRGACAHPDGTVALVRSLLATFPQEVAGHLHGRCRIEAAA